jgi:hypothetical protein
MSGVTEKVGSDKKATAVNFTSLMVKALQSTLISVFNESNFSVQMHLTKQFAFAEYQRSTMLQLEPLYCSMLLSNDWKQRPLLGNGHNRFSTRINGLS